jgi:mRNA interferase RelE/StbE
MNHHYELTTRAEKDLRKIDPQARRPLVAALDRLVEVPQPKNLDIETISGHEPFCRLRIGDWRIIYRPLADHEIAILVMRRGSLESTTGFLIERIIDRQHLKRVVATLELVELS